MSDESDLIGQPLDDVPQRQPDEHCNAKKVDRSGEPPYPFGGYCPADAGAWTDHHGEGRCKNHGGSTPTKAENPDHGGQPGNANALKHGARAKPENLLDHLGGDDRAFVEQLTEQYVESAPFGVDDPRAERVRIMAVMIWQEWSGREQIARDGISVTQEEFSKSGDIIERQDAHYLLEHVSRINNNVRKMLKDFGWLDDPQSQTADALGEIAVEINRTRVTEDNVDEFTGE